jgi:glucose-1-phosphate adenylyltransferase
MNNADVLAVILGGGRGARLWPLTKDRAKPAVPIGGKYRLIDVPLSNCLNAGIQRIAVLTQFNSVSLHRHIARTYQFDLFHEGWVQVLAAEQTTTMSDWYQGTADAVRKQLSQIQSAKPSEVLILAGDQLYRMDYAGIIERHRAEQADITIGVRPVSASDARRFGILRQTPEGEITDFVEKPQAPDTLRRFTSSDNDALPHLASMGIYVFRPSVLTTLLNSTHVDFGSELVPAALGNHRVVGHLFDGYWEDIGTVRAFYEANLQLAQPNPPFSFHHPAQPIYTHPRFLPGCRIYDVRLDSVLLADGCVVEHANISNAVIGNRSIIRSDVRIADTIVMGADYYAEPKPGSNTESAELGIGRGTRISGAIIDKNARIGEGVTIDPFPRGTDAEGKEWYVRDGIVVIPKNTTIPAGSVISPT